MRRKQHIKVHSEFLILPGGRILAHNLTPTMARLLAELNRCDEIMSRRAFAGVSILETATGRVGDRRSKHA